jgi:hypothetical protein
MTARSGPLQSQRYAWAGLTSFVLILAAMNAAHSANCTDPFSFAGLPELEVNGSVAHDEICTITYGKPGGMITSYKVVSRPTHGILGSAGYRADYASGNIRYLTAYKPSRGYVGRDNFSLIIRYGRLNYGIQNTIKLIVHMLVTP